MKKTYVGKLVDVSQWDDPPEYGIVIDENDDFVPTVLTVYLFDDERICDGFFTSESLKFVEER